MQANSKIIIVDTSCLIILSKINELAVLRKVGEEIYIIPEIHKEFGKRLPNWILISTPKNYQYQQILELELDKGEASAIALSVEIANSVLILDDLKGRKIANHLDLKFSGTFGLILRAKRIGAIKKVKPILNKIRLTDFRFSEKLFETILDQAGE